MSKLPRQLRDPLIGRNPVSVETLGICSALAVTLQVKTAIIMALAMIFVTSTASLIISLCRKSIPHQIRLVIQLSIIATLVILADMLIQAFFFEIGQKLTVYVGLIITNCIILGRTESYAMHNRPLVSWLDGIGNGLGYGAVLLIISSVREVFGSGSWLGMQILPNDFPKNSFMLMPAGAFIVLGLLVWLQNSLTKGRENERD